MGHDDRDIEIMARIRAWEDANDADDGTAPGEKLFLYSLTRLLHPNRVIEVGVSAGGATAWIAGALEAADCGELISVDDWSCNDGGLANSPKPASDRLRQLDLGHRVTLVTASSHDWLPEQETNSAQMAWIDGDHTYDGALSDLTQALRIATDLVVFHDVDHLNGPEQVSRELLPEGMRIRRRRGMLLLSPADKAEFNELGNRE